MLRLVIILSLIILTIPDIQSDSSSSEPTEQTNTEPSSSWNTESSDSTTTTEQSSSWSAESSDSTTTTEQSSSWSTEPSNSTTTPVSFESSTSTIIPTPSNDTDPTENTTSTDWTTTESSSPETQSETTEQTSPVSISSTAMISTATKEPSYIQIFSCNFNTSCFGEGQLEITNGSEFNSPALFSDTRPTRIPLSDVTSITEATSDGEICKLPYQPTLDGSTEPTTWNMSFCYRQHCFTENKTNATCASGSYGLISLNASETSKTVSQSNLTELLRDSFSVHFLSFYYYFTVDEDQSDWGQQIQIWIKSNNETDAPISLGNLTVKDMQGNKWELRNIIFQSPFKIDTLEFVFHIDVNNSMEDAQLNETIYFALDNIELYDSNEPSTISPTSLPPMTTTTNRRVTDPPKTTDWGMIIGLSVGIGIPVLLVLTGAIVLYKKKGRRPGKLGYDIPLTSTRPRTNSDIFSNPYLF